MNVLEIRSLAKRFGKQQVIDGLDLVVPEGSVFGFIGRNGSGQNDDDEDGARSFAPRCWGDRRLR